MALAFLTTLGTFLVDLATPRGYAEGIFYVVPVLTTLWLPRNRDSFIVLVGCTVLSIVGYFVSSPGDYASMALFNRSLTIVTIWITSALVLQVKKEKQSLHDTNDALEARVALRTQELTQSNDQLRQEIEDRKQAEQHLTQSNGKLEQFAYVASHDMQEPLRMVTSYLQLLEKRYKDKLNSTGTEFIRYAVDGATRMRMLINGLLDLARIQTKGRPFSRVEGDVALDQALANLRIAIRESGAEITRDPLPAFWGDAAQLVQLFQNLIGNAVKYRGNQPPRIHIGVDAKSEERQEHVISIRDNGIGLDPAFAEDIFVLFRRLHSAGEYSGTGIGLALCKSIIERHGGRIWVQSQPGQGSVFSFALLDRKEEKHGAAHAGTTG